MGNPAKPGFKIGTKVGSWEIIGPSERVQEKAGTFLMRQLCRCVCGQERKIRNFTLRQGRSHSCGCKRWSLQDNTEYFRIRKEKRFSLENETVTYSTSKGDILVDLEDIDFIRKNCVYISHPQSTGIRYAVLIPPVNGYHYLHDLIMDTKYLDHKNDNGLDNRRENLRICNPSENCGNSRKPVFKNGAKPSSRYKGVCRHKQAGKWFAYIKVDRVRKYLGLFEIEEDAAEAYDRAAYDAWGEFARLNLINQTNKEE